ncbi:MAG: DUF2975 domain-containing protein [Clostridia bacterium]|nr:DUF2975 domain-containing protein [Clostridia bacterium]
MLRISKRQSVNLSLAISVIFFVLCIAGAFALPFVLRLYVEMRNMSHISTDEFVYILVVAYLILAVFVLADVLLFKLLQRVKYGAVFTPKSVALIRGVSWCCLAASLLFCCVGIFFYICFAIGLAGIFLGLCLRVTKNVIAEATEIKSENDLTV